MLVLTRKSNEAVRIGDDVEVVVLSVQGNRVRLGITAPACVPIRRDDAHFGTSADGHDRELLAELELCLA